MIKVGMGSTNIKPLKHPPITEAVIEVRWRKPLLFSDSTIDLIKNLFKEPFGEPEVRKSSQWTFKIGEDSNQPNMTELGPSQMVFKHSKYILNISHNKIVISNIHPYAGWDDLYKTFLKVISITRTKLNVTSLNRIGVRYVNNLNIPRNGGDIIFKDYITTAPELPPGVSNSVLGFINRLIVSDKERNATAVISHALDQNRALITEKVPLIFDIDVFKTGEFSTEESKLNNVLSLLREMKNEIFFNTLTDKCKALYSE